jgi:hypothetical protein
MSWLAKGISSLANVGNELTEQAKDAAEQAKDAAGRIAAEIRQNQVHSKRA